jgi:hypothetical protein
MTSKTASPKQNGEQNATPRHRVDEDLTPTCSKTSPASVHDGHDEHNDEHTGPHNACPRRRAAEQHARRAGRRPRRADSTGSAVSRTGKQNGVASRRARQRRNCFHGIHDTSTTCEEYVHDEQHGGQNDWQNVEQNGVRDKQNDWQNGLHDEPSATSRTAGTTRRMSRTSVHTSVHVCPRLSTSIHDGPRLSTSRAERRPRDPRRAARRPCREGQRPRPRPCQAERRPRDPRRATRRPRREGRPPRRTGRPPHARTTSRTASANDLQPLDWCLGFSHDTASTTERTVSMEVRDEQNGGVHYA